MESNYSVQVGDWITSGRSSYQVLKILGCGSFGKVVLCHKSPTNQLVALKVLIALEDDDIGHQEARILQLLRERDSEAHHIVQCSDSFLFKGHHCYEFEKLDISLEGFLKTCPDQSLSLKDIRPIIAQMARALVFLKSEGIAHCDLKPDNIMLVDHVGQPLRINLIDFGLACPVKEAIKGKLTQTFYCRAPEVQVGGAITEAIDMWSVGCIAAQMFLGKILFCAEDDQDLMRHVIQIVGQPPDHVLNSGRQTYQFFQQPNRFAFWGQNSRIKSPKHPSTLTVQKLEDIVRNTNPAETYDCRQFVDLLKKMLDVDPETRITPEEVLKHPFITMCKLQTFFPLYHTANKKIMSQVLNLPLEEDQKAVSDPRKTVEGLKLLPRKRRMRHNNEPTADESSGESKQPVGAIQLSENHRERPSQVDAVSSGISKGKRKRDEEEQVEVIGSTIPSPPAKQRSKRQLSRASLRRTSPA